MNSCFLRCVKAKRRRKKPGNSESDTGCWSDSKAAALAAIWLPAMQNGSKVKWPIRSAPRIPQRCAAPLKQLSGPCLTMQIGHFRARMSAAPLKRRCMATQFEVKPKAPQRRGYSLATMATRLDVADMPSGRFTSQRRSLWSTCRTRLALPGGWLMGASTSRKSGPIWATAMELPLTNSRIFTWAEWPP